MTPRTLTAGVLVLTGFLALTGFAPTAPPPEQAPRAKTRHAAVEERVFEIVNFERASRGLRRLAPEPILAEIARDHSVDMLEREFFAHESPDGDGPSDRVSVRHRRLVGTIAENIWTSLRGPVEDALLAGDIMRGLMNSPGHRENILREGLTHMGIAVHSAPGPDVVSTEVMATQLFASVQAYTGEPVPHSFRWGALVNFRVLPFGEGGREATFFDIWSDGEERAVHGPSPLRRARIDAPRGIYQLRFYFRRGSRFAYEIFPGPRIIVE